MSKEEKEKEKTKKKSLFSKIKSIASRVTFVAKGIWNAEKHKEMLVECKILIADNLKDLQLEAQLTTLKNTEDIKKELKQVSSKIDKLLSQGDRSKRIKNQILRKLWETNFPKSATVKTYELAWVINNELERFEKRADARSRLELGSEYESDSTLHSNLLP